MSTRNKRFDNRKPSLATGSKAHFKSRTPRSQKSKSDPILSMNSAMSRFTQSILRPLKLSPHLLEGVCMPLPQPQVTSMRQLEDGGSKDELDAVIVPNVQLTMSHRRGGRTGRQGGERTWMGIGNVPQYLKVGRSNQVYTFTQGIGVSTFAATTSFTVSAVMVQFGNLAQASVLGAFFDQYRIAEVELTFRPRYTVGIASSPMPNLYTVIDYDDAATPTATVAFFQQYTNLQTTMYETQVRAWIPHISMGGLDNTGLVAGVNVTSPWLDMADAAFEHFGCKFGCDATSPATQAWNIDYKITVQCRNIR